jgi:nitrite reductase (NO-forming)
MTRVIVAISAVVSMVLLTLIYGAVSQKTAATQASPSAAAVASPAAESTATPAASPPAVTIDEISRHPSDMPDSPNYTEYSGGTWSNPVTRTGPITITAHFQIKEGVAQVVTGTYLEYWTFDGTVPGPMIRGMVGDTVDFFLTNPADSTMPHDVDFHAVTGPGGGSVSLDTAPGATSELKVKLLHPGIYIYHCAFPDIPTHIAHGMYGLVVVEPEGGLPKVDHEYYLMQSELYTSAGADKSYTALENQGLLQFDATNGNLEEPTFVVWNGRPESVTGDRALGVYGGDTINTGDTVRLFVGNIGPNLIASFHAIGEMFDTVYVDGSFALENHWVQTTLIPAGGAVGVEITVEVPGDYTILDHAIFRVHKGIAAVMHVTGAARPDIYDSITYTKSLRGSSGQ